MSIGLDSYDNNRSSNNVSVKESIILFNAQFSLNTEDGRSLSIISTILVSFFVFSTISLHFWRSIRNTQYKRRILISKWNSVLSLLHSIIIVIQEVFMIYGERLGLSINIYNRVSMLVVLSWVISNAMSCISLFVSWISTTKYRIMLYMVYAIQMNSCSIILAERILLNSPAYDFIIPVSLLFLSVWMVYSVPSVYQMDGDRFKYEETRYLNKGQSGQRYLLIKEKEDGDDGDDDINIGNEGGDDNNENNRIGNGFFMMEERKHR